MRISDWSSDVCSSDLDRRRVGRAVAGRWVDTYRHHATQQRAARRRTVDLTRCEGMDAHRPGQDFGCGHRAGRRVRTLRSEEHTSELQSLMRISYAVFCLKKKTAVYQQPVVHPK